MDEDPLPISWFEEDEIGIDSASEEEELLDVDMAEESSFAALEISAVAAGKEEEQDCDILDWDAGSSRVGEATTSNWDMELLEEDDELLGVRMEEEEERDSTPSSRNHPLLRDGDSDELDLVYSDREDEVGGFPSTSHSSRRFVGLEEDMLASALEDESPRPLGSQRPPPGQTRSLLLADAFNLTLPPKTKPHRRRRLPKALHPSLPPPIASPPVFALASPDSNPTPTPTSTASSITLASQEPPASSPSKIQPLVASKENALLLPAKIPIVKGREPTQEEMDALFGYVPIDIAAVVKGKMDSAAEEIGHLSRELPSLGSIGGEDLGPRLSRNEKGKAVEPSTEGEETSTPAPIATLPRKEVYQLEPIPKVSAATGLPMTAEEKRYVITHFLRRR